MAGPLVGGMRQRAKAFIEQQTGQPANSQTVELVAAFVKGEFRLATKETQCPLCTRLTRFEKVIDFFAHMREKHSDVLSAEEDEETCRQLDEGLERRKIRDAEVSSMRDKLAS